MKGKSLDRRVLFIRPSGTLDRWMTLSPAMNRGATIVASLRDDSGGAVEVHTAPRRFANCVSSAPSGAGSRAYDAPRVPFAWGELHPWLQSFAPFGAGPHGNATPRVAFAWGELHPWLHSFAPFGAGKSAA